MTGRQALQQIERDHEHLRVACPLCKAWPWSQCFTTGRGVPRKCRTHQERIDASREVVRT